MNRPLALAIAGLLAALLLLGTIQKLDHDEIVHVHTAWMIFDGHAPARDFQVRHHPLYHYATAPLYAWIQDAGDILLAHRGLMWVNLLVLTVLVVLAGRRLADTRTGLWSAVFLLTTTTLAVGTIEARPDPVQATLSFLAVVVLLPGGIASGAPQPAPGGTGSGARRLLAAGLLTGLALCVLQKALYGLVAAAPAVLWSACAGTEGPPARRFGAVLTRLVAFGLGVVAPVLLMVAYHNHIGALDNYLLYCWKWNAAYASSRQVRWEEVFRWFHRSPHVWVLAFAGCALAVRRPAWAVAVAIPFAAQAAGVVLSGAQYKQYLLGLWPFAALLAGLAHTAILDHLRDRRLYVLLLALVLVARPGRVFSIIVMERDLMLGSLEAIRFVQHATGLTERVFDDDHALNVMRRNTSFNWFGHEEDFADLSRAAGKPMRPDRVAELAAHRPRIVVHALHKDTRVHDHVRARYRQHLTKELWIASVRATADASGRATVDLPAAGRYVVRRTAPGSRPPAVRFRPAGPNAIEGLEPGEAVVVELELP